MKAARIKGAVVDEGDSDGGRDIEQGAERAERAEGIEGTEIAETSRGGRGVEEVEGRGERGTDKPEETTTAAGGGRGVSDLSVVTRTEPGNGMIGIPSGNNSETMEGEPTEAGKGTSSYKSSDGTDAAEGVLVDGE